MVTFMTLDELIQNQPLDFKEVHKQRTRYVADFEATTYFETDDPKLNVIEAENSIDGKRHVYPKSKHQRVDVWLWCLQNIESDEQVVGYSIESFIDYIKENCLYADIIFHNGENYDSRFIFDYCIHHGYEPVEAGKSYGGHANIICGTPRKYTLWFDNHNAINFLDSTSYQKTSIREWGRVLSEVNQTEEQKGDTPLIVSDDYYKDDFKVKQEWIDYCKRDVQILRDMVTFAQTIDGGSDLGKIKLDMNLFKKYEAGYPTIASYALATYQNSGNEPDVSYNTNFEPVAKPHLDKIIYRKQIIKGWHKVEKQYNKTIHFNLHELTDDEAKAIIADPNASVDAVMGIVTYHINKTYTEYECERQDATAEELKQYREYRKQFRAKYGSKKKNTKSPRARLHTKHKSGIKQIEEVKEQIKNASREEKPRLRNALNHKLNVKRIVETNKIAKRSYKGGISLAGPYHMNAMLKDIQGYEIDVNSLYPSIYGNIMFRQYHQGRDYALPQQQFDQCIQYPSKRQITTWSHKLALFELDVTASVEKDWLPLIKPRTDDEYNSSMSIIKVYGDPREQYWPRINLNKIVLTAPEMDYLLNHYKITYLKVHRIWTFQRDTELEEAGFKHVQKFSKLKQYSKGDNDKGIKFPALRNWSKLELNSAYGKLGNFDKTYDRKIVTESGVEIKIGENPGGNKLAHVAAASYITAYGRVYMAEMIHRAGYENFLYCDTDSMYLIGEPSKEMKQWINDTKIGYWALEKHFTKGKFIKSKCYGVKLTNGQWQSTAAGFDKTIPQNEFTIGTKQIISRSKVVNGGKLIFKTYQEIRPLNQSYINELNQFYQLNIK